MAKVGFVTCVQLGLSCMQAIYDSGGELAFAMTLLDSQAKTKSGRVYLDEFCNKHEIPLLKSSHVNNDDVVQAVKDAELDWLFIIGWSQIATETLLNAPKKGVLGMHPTLLPVGRGRAAIPWAILKGLSKTGVTLFKLDAGVDTGPILDQVEIPLTDTTTATELYQKVDGAHVALIKKVIPALLADNLKLQVQDETKATEWPGRRPEDGLIDLQGSVFQADKMVRALTKPYPGAYFVRDGRRIVVWRANLVSSDYCGDCLSFNDGKLELLEYEVC